MTVQEVLLAAAFGAASALVGIGFAAYWPEWPPIDDTPIPSWMLHGTLRDSPRHRGPKHRRARVLFLNEDLEEIDPPPVLPSSEPPAEPWMWREETPEHRPRHRWEDIGQGTQRLAPPE